MEFQSRRVGNPSSDIITANDERHRDRMAVSSTLLLNAIEKARSGTKFPRKALPANDLLWHDGSFGGRFEGNPLSVSVQRAAKSVANSMAAKEAARARVVTRDPCPKCGTRHDIGCAHSRVA